MSARSSTLSRRDSTRVLRDVLVPLAARGLIVRRSGAVALLSAADADARAVRRLRALRDMRGPSPAALRLPRRRVTVVLSAADAREVLERTPEPFTPANREKRAALAQFEPHGVLISDAASRPARRALNERALETGRPRHQLGLAMHATVLRHATALTDDAVASGELAYDRFAESFAALTREIVLGARAADDSALTGELSALRRAANWSFLAPLRQRRRQRFLSHLAGLVARAPGDSLAGHAVAGGEAGEDPVRAATEQIPQWLFAFDAAGIALYATLALLSTHRPELARARETASAERAGGLDFLRACVLETLRLWPTTPAILRDSTEDTDLGGTTLRAGSAVVLFTPLFHRDQRLRPDAERFVPGRWLRAGRLVDDPDPTVALLPFSHGAGRCPGREVVLHITSTLLAELVGRVDLTLTGPQAENLSPGRLPGTLDHFRLAFTVAPAHRSPSTEGVGQ